jgi:hypothetical protein
MDVQQIASGLVYGTPFWYKTRFSMSAYGGPCKNLRN